MLSTVIELSVRTVNTVDFAVRDVNKDLGPKEVTRTSSINAKDLGPKTNWTWALRLRTRYVEVNGKTENQK